MSQLGPTKDERMNELSRLIGEQEKIKDDAQEKFDNAWAEVFETFDEFDRQSSDQARFIANDGFYLQRQIRAGRTVLDEEGLLRHLTPEQIAAITKRVIVPSLLESAVQMGLIEHDLVANFVSEGDPIPVRMRKKWTSADKRMAAQMGIEVVEIPEENPS